LSCGFSKLTDHRLVLEDVDELLYYYHVSVKLNLSGTVEEDVIVVNLVFTVDVVIIATSVRSKLTPEPVDVFEYKLSAENH